MSTTPTTPTPNSPITSPTDAPLPVLGHLPSRWEPPTDARPPIRTHAGESLSPNTLYLAAPPLEIGKIRTVASSINASKGIEPQVLRRIGGTIGGAAVGFLVVWALGAKVGFWYFGDMPLPIGIISAIIGAIVGFFVSKPDYHTSYVGENGVAYFKYGSRNKPIANARIFPFERGSVLHVTQTRNHTNGVYSNTTYAFNWKDAAGKSVHIINGQHNSKPGTPPKNHPYYFAVSAENAWSRYMLPICRAKLAYGESVIFPVAGKGTVGVSLRGLQVNFGGKSEEIPKEEIGGLGINNGQVTISRIGAKKGFMGVGKEGMFTFSYPSLGNARLFLALLAEVVGKEAPEPTADAADSTGATTAPPT